MTIKKIFVANIVFLLSFILLGAGIAHARSLASENHKLYIDLDTGLYVPFQDYRLGSTSAIKADYLLPVSRPFQFMAGLELGLIWPRSFERTGTSALLSGNYTYKAGIVKAPVYLNFTYPFFFLDKYLNIKGENHLFAGFGLGFQMVRSKMELFGNESIEKDTAFAFHFFIEIRRPMGPGYLRLINDFDFVKADTIQTGNKTLSGYALRLGYGMGFL